MDDLNGSIHDNGQNYSNSKSQQMLDKHNETALWSKLKQLFSHNRVAWGLISINYFCILQPYVQLFLHFADYLMILYTPAVILYASKNHQYIENTWQLEVFLHNPGVGFLLYFMIAILALMTLCNLMLVWIFNKSNSLNKSLSGNGIIEKTAGVLILMFNSTLSVPILHITLRSFFITYSQGDQAQYYLLIVGSVISLVLQLWILIIKRLLIIRIPLTTHLVTQLDGRPSIMKYFTKVSFVLAHILLSKYKFIFDSYRLLVVLILLFVSAIVNLYVVMCVSFHNSSFNFTQIGFYLIYTILLLMAVIDNKPYVVAPFVIAVYIVVYYKWRKRIFWNLTNGHLKMEFEYHYALESLTRALIPLSNENTRTQDQNIKLIIAIIKNHSEKCSQTRCLCHQIDSVIWALNSQQNKQQQIIHLQEEDIQLMSIIHEQSIFCYSKDETAVFQNKEFDLIRTLYISEKISSQPIENSKLMTVSFKNSSISQIVSDFQGIHLVETNIQGSQIGTDDNNIDKSKERKINPFILRKAYFSNLMRIYFEEALKSYPQNYVIRLQYAYFALVNMKNIFLCINILQNLQDNKLGWYNRVNMKLNEGFFILEIQKLMKKQNDYQSGYNLQSLGLIEAEKNLHQNQDDIFEHNLNPDHFIRLTNLYQKFNCNTQTLNQHVIEFWKMLIDKNFDLKRTLETLLQVSEDIEKVQTTFQQIDNISKLKDSQIYYFYGVIHKYLLNDDQGYELYMNKTASIRNMHRILKNNYQNTGPDTEIGIVVCQGTEKNFGKIILCNQKIKELTKYDDGDLKHQSIEIFMPGVIKENHSRFIERFNRSGQSYILNKIQNVFFQCKNGYITPVNQHVKYHHSQQYGHTFISFCKKVKELQIWKQLQKNKNIEKVMFFICDDQELKVLGLSKNCSKLLGLKMSYLNGNEVITKTNNFTMSDISPLMNLGAIKEAEKNQFPNQQISRVYEGQFELIYSFLTSQIIRQKKLNLKQKKQIQFKIFRESYLDSKFDLYIVALEFVEDGINDNSEESCETIAQIEMENNSDAIVSTYEKREKKENESSCDDSSLNESQTSKVYEEIKGKFSSGKHDTPRSLRFAVQLIVLVFLAMVSISSLNFYIAKNRNDSLDLEIDIFQNSYNRMILTSNCKLFVQQLILMANGYESFNSNILSNKYEEIRSSLFQTQEQLRLIQGFLDNTGFEYSESFSNYLKQDILNLTYLNEDNSISYKNQSITFGMNIFVARLLDVYNMRQTELVGNLSIQTLIKPNIKYKPSLAERTIYFVSENSLDSIRVMNQNVKEMYVKEIKENSDNSAYQTQLTVIISICAIVVVGFVVTPILTKIQDKQFIAIQFFFKISYQKIKSITQMTEKFQHEMENFFNFDQNQSSSNEKRMIQSSIDSESQIYMLNAFSKNSEVTLIDHPYQSTMGKRSILIGTQNKTSEFKSSYNIDKITDKQGLQTISNYGLLESMANRSSIKTQYEIPQNRKISVDEDDSRSDIIKMKDIDLQFDQKVLEQVEIDKEDIQLMEELKYQQMSKQKLRMKCRVFFICLTFVLSFSIYFIGSYFMALRTYNSIPIVIDGLDLIFSKGFCIENVFAFVRESQITNSTEKAKIASKHLETCYSFESQYQNFRRHLPSSFSNIQALIDSIEGNGICEATNNEFHSQYMQSKCPNAINGILNKGLSNSIQYSMSHFQQQNMKMSEKNRSLEYLKKLLLEEQTAELINMKAFIIDQTLNLYFREAISSVKEYFKSIIKEYTILFSMFICFLALIALIFMTIVYNRIKEYLWKTNISLRILPIKYLPLDQIKPLKQFYAHQ